jgi:hypothetical protein
LSLSRGRERERRREGKKERLFEEIRKREKGENRKYKRKFIIYFYTL